VSAFTVNCTVWWGLVVRLRLAGPECQAGGAPTWAADTWRLAAKPGRWAGHTRWPRYRLQSPGARSAQPWALRLPTCVLGRPSAHVALGLTASVLVDQPHMWRLG